MSEKITTRINNIADPQTRQALQALWTQLKSDLAANKATFDAHTHKADGSKAGSYDTSAPQSDAGDVVIGTAVTFVQNLK